MPSTQLIGQNAPEESKTIAILPKLDDRARAVLIGLMIGKNYEQAAQIAGVSPKTLRRYKPKLEPLLNQVAPELESKSWQMLRGSILDATATLIKGLRQPSYRYQFEAAKNILDRILGQPTQKIEARGQLTILGIEVTQAQAEALTKPEITSEIIENDPVIASRTPQNPKGGLDITEV